MGQSQLYHYYEEIRRVFNAIRDWCNSPNSNGDNPVNPIYVIKYDYPCSLVSNGVNTCACYCSLSIVMNLKQKHFFSARIEQVSTCFHFYSNIVSNGIKGVFSIKILVVLIGD